MIFDVVYSPAYPGLSYGYTGLSGGAHKHEYILNVNLMSLPTKISPSPPSVRVQKEDWNANSALTGTLGTDAQRQHLIQQRTRFARRVRTPGPALHRRDQLVFNAGGQWTEGQGN